MFLKPVPGGWLERLQSGIFDTGPVIAEGARQLRHGQN
jgi:hypothetical protein